MSNMFEITSTIATGAITFFASSSSSSSASSFFSPSSSSPLPTPSSSPSPAPKWWDTHAGSTVGGMLSFFGSVLAGWIAFFGLLSPCLAQWRMSELREFLKDPDIPEEIRKQRKKLLEEHYELLERGVFTWLWHQQPRWILRFFSRLGRFFSAFGRLLSGFGRFFSPVGRFFAEVWEAVGFLFCLFARFDLQLEIPWKSWTVGPRAGHPNSDRSPNGFKIRMRRLVSGKVAEEGTAGN